MVENGGGEEDGAGAVRSTLSSLTAPRSEFCRHELESSFAGYLAYCNNYYPSGYQI